jgi:hypothetical protein
MIRIKIIIDKALSSLYFEQSYKNYLFYEVCKIFNQRASSKRMEK